MLFNKYGGGHALAPSRTKRTRRCKTLNDAREEEEGRIRKERGETYEDTNETMSHLSQPQSTSTVPSETDGLQCIAQGAYGVVVQEPDTHYLLKIAKPCGTVALIQEMAVYERLTGMGCRCINYKGFRLLASGLALKMEPGGITLRCYLDTLSNKDNIPNVLEQCVLLVKEMQHKYKLLHCDLHSGNILVNPKNNKVTIIDFGRACFGEDLEHGTRKKLEAQDWAVLIRGFIEWIQAKNGKKKRKRGSENISDRICIQCSEDTSELPKRFREIIEALETPEEVDKHDANYENRLKLATPALCEALDELERIAGA